MRVTLASVALAALLTLGSFVVLSSYFGPVMQTLLALSAGYVAYVVTACLLGHLP